MTTTTVSLIPLDDIRAWFDDGDVVYNDRDFLDVMQAHFPNTDPRVIEVVAYTDDNRKSVLAERVPLARPVYVTHLVTDKPLYKPGEIVRFRSLTLDRATFLPPEHDLHLQFKLRKPDGATIPLDDGNGRVMDGLKPVIGPDGKPVRGIGTGEFFVEPDAPGGDEQPTNLTQLGFNHLALRVDDLDEMAAHLEANGVRPLNEAMSFIGRRLQFYEGPEGATIELVQWLDAPAPATT